MSVVNVFANIAQDSSAILGNSKIRNRIRTVAQYFKLTAKDVGIRRHLMSLPAFERIGNQSFAYSTYPMLISLWREIYAKTPYYFESESRTPKILDVGSNIGLGVLYIKSLFPQSRVTAFEPDARAYKILLENVRLNSLQDVTLVNKAVFNFTGSLTWHFDGDRPDSLSMSIVAREKLADSMQVPCVCLSDYIDEPVDFLKLDVEGVEGEVLAELKEKDKLRLVRQMAIEYHPWSKRSLSDICNQLDGYNVEIENCDASRPRMIRAALKTGNN